MVEKTGFSVLVRQTVREKEIFVFKPALPHFKKVTLCHILLVAEELGEYILSILCITFKPFEQ